MNTTSTASASLCLSEYIEGTPLLPIVQLFTQSEEPLLTSAAPCEAYKEFYPEQNHWNEHLNDLHANEPNIVSTMFQGLFGDKGEDFIFAG